MKGHFPAGTHKPVQTDHGTVICSEHWILQQAQAELCNLSICFQKGSYSKSSAVLCGITSSIWHATLCLYVLCHQGSFSMLGFFLCCSLCMVQGLPAKLNPPRQFVQTEVHSRNRGEKEALLGAENAAGVVLSLCLSPWLKTTILRDSPR